MSRTITYSCNHQHDIMPANYNLLKQGEMKLPKNGNVYYWHIANTSSKIAIEDVIEAIRHAFDIWQAAMDNIPPIGRYIHIQSTSEIEKADIVLSFGDLEHFIHNVDGTEHCPFPFDKQEGTLAHAWSLMTTHPFGGQVHLDDDEDWSHMHTAHDKHLLTVLIHELGHVFNLDHTDIKAAIMYPQYTGIKTELHQDDLEGLLKVFSPLKFKLAPSSAKQTNKSGFSLLKHLKWFKIKIQRYIQNFGI